MFGTYTFKYVPNQEDGDRIYPNVDLSISGEANLSEILESFRDFLAASRFPVSFEDEIELRKNNEGQS